MSSNNEEKKPEIVITDKSYDLISVVVKCIPKEIFGMDLKYRRSYDYTENGEKKTESVHSFSEFKEKVGI